MSPERKLELIGLELVRFVHDDRDDVETREAIHVDRLRRILTLDTPTGV